MRRPLRASRTQGISNSTPYSNEKKANLFTAINMYATMNNSNAFQSCKARTSPRPYMKGSTPPPVTNVPFDAMSTGCPFYKGEPRAPVEGKELQINQRRQPAGSRIHGRRTPGLECESTSPRLGFEKELRLGLLLSLHKIPN